MLCWVQTLKNNQRLDFLNGEGGIRTHGAREVMLVFKTKSNPSCYKRTGALQQHGWTDSGPKWHKSRPGSSRWSSKPSRSDLRRRTDLDQAPAPPLDQPSKPPGRMASDRRRPTPSQPAGEELLVCSKEEGRPSQW